MPVGILLAWSMAAQPPAQPSPSSPLEPIKSSITVAEKVTTDTPANISDISVKDLQLTPGVNIDDRLREVPGFSLFRRTSSVVANPTTQGVSLRGIGSTGASRSLVLWDGVPMNDPFGGWVYWTRFPVQDLDRVEISRGASTSVFGDMAMGGAIGLFSREPSHLHANFNYQGGNKNTQDVSGGFSDLWNHFAVSGSARGFSTDGYYVVPASVRGAIDRRAGVKFATGDLRFDWFAGKDKVFVSFDALAEERPNGTRLTYNSTGLGTAAIHYVHEFAHDEISFVGFRSEEEFHSTYSAIGAGRNAETLTTRQTAPSNGNGADLLWNHHGGAWNVIGGADVNQDRGFSYDHTVATHALAISGGTLLQHGEFVQGDYRKGAFQFFGGARQQFTGQGRTFFSPSAGLAYGRRGWRARGSVYRAYRSPTLNELYRQFRVGNTVTQANNALTPETLFGAEMGADYQMERGGLHVTAFRNALNGLITNVTQTSTPTLITRKRKNTGDSLSRGFEISLDHRWREFRGEASYLYADSRYGTGFRIPQVAKSQGSAGVSYEHGRLLASVSVRGVSSQFDDDLNLFRLPGFVSVQSTVRERLFKNVSASLEVENILDRLYYTGFTPTPTIGAPRLIRIGFRWDGKL
jgi:outer membrane receptor protein involved in Fe transport